MAKGEGYQPLGIETSNAQAPAPPILRRGRREAPVLRSPRRKGPSRLTQAVEITTAFATVATGAGLLGSKAATGHFPWENQNPAIVVPGESPAPSRTATIPSPTIPGATLEITFPPNSSPTPEATATPGATKTPEATASPEVEDDVQKALDNWLKRDENGAYPMDSMPSRFLVGFDFSPLGILDHTTYSYTTVFYQGKLIIYDIVKNHLIVYMGEEDWGKNGKENDVAYGKNERYYKAYDAGILSDAKLYDNFKVNGVYPFDLPINLISSNKMKGFIEAHTGEVVAYEINNTRINPGDFGGVYKARNNYFATANNKQVKAATETVDFSKELMWKKTPLSDISNAEKEKLMINTRITPENFDESKIPFLWGIMNKKG
jgi:hypothetical protein